MNKVTSENKPRSEVRSAKPNPLTARMATSLDEVKQAQRLRAEAFGPAFGLNFENGLDVDRFDAYCAHLLVFEGDRLVATTRMMDRERACLAGGFYSEQEFDLHQILHTTNDNIVEIGRTCVAPGYSSARAINTLWQGVTETAGDWGADILMGCASVTLNSGDCQGWLNSLPDKQRLPVAVPARNPLPATDTPEPPQLPTVLKMYLRMNARLGSEACYDPEFNCADVLIWLSLARMGAKYRERWVA